MSGDARAEAGRAPDLVEPVVGFRAWRVIGDRLLSPYVPCRWEGRVLHAECFDANRRLMGGRGWLAAPHSAPHPDCQCGIYAYHRPGRQAYYGEWEVVEGLVTAWGRLEVHRDGLRAEHARVEVLLGRPDIAARLGCDTVGTRAELLAAAPRFGAPLPERLQPVPGARDG